MELVPIKGSSNIKAYAWEEAPVNRQLFKGRQDARVQRHERLGLLQIEFKDGARWYYFNVPVLVFDAFLLSKSRGAFVARWIRGRFNEKRASEVEQTQIDA